MIMVGGLMFTSFAGPLWGVEGISPMLQLTDQREAREVFTGTAVTAVIFVALAVWRLVRWRVIGNWQVVISEGWKN